MSLVVRALLVSVQAIGNQLACTPPNATNVKTRYHTNEPYILQMAPLMFKIHTTLLWLCALFEAISAINFYVPCLPVQVEPFFSSTTRPISSITPLFMIGVLVSLSGVLIRLRCFRELGHLFTFDLTFHPEHKLVTSGFYRYVRHPSYTGSLLLVAGLALSHCTRGSWARECGPLGQMSAVVLGTGWCIWAISVCISRAYAEDGELRKNFGAEWDAYAARVPAWFFPGLL
ncbi:hypothetical protein SERLA73DRAFT_189043 [Serpula lacrymans var. lacrymans S7.3]|uniref:Protein-S-isoprenylcysteine O-methyltransferase n=2 Tax=Serpula lacrymans var. lacrymans TaxID=341189 RepID=F8QCQ4_SERL3|nr:uncharacterized protein SERLADRAFT_374544 [Serpula lacrymans var. lacrymans S7.9]EGN93919.1 hypothetical protein SERLA73DRAFT_189043 [Serpula lacrymans var. lacrymans S7.3]EGO19285.1 hypothetical protein SERLADRAFT_374544 [Serpula lacrymans var. lacrymans S7.9]